MIDNNRIHDCGTDPNVVWTAQDSGAHGIYLVNTVNAVVTNNLVYDNQWRGIQSWPRGQGSLIANNVFDGNATNVNLGSALPDGYPWMTVNTIVRDNIITNATLWNSGKNPAQVHGYFPADGIDYGNRVTGNCMYIADATKNFSGNGYTQSGNTFADPHYLDRAAKDFRLPAGSPCVGKGPASIQPAVAPPPPAARLLGDAHCRQRHVHGPRPSRRVLDVHGERA